MEITHKSGIRNRANTDAETNMRLDPSKNNGEALFKAVLDTVSDAIMVIDRDLKVIYQNEAVYKVYGSKIGERCFEAYRRRQEPCENCIILEVIKDGKSRRALRISSCRTATSCGWKFFQDPSGMTRKKS